MLDVETQIAHLDEALDALKDRVGDPAPAVGLVLGTGLGKLAEEIDVSEAVPYGEVPHFPVSTVESHAGQLLVGTLDDVPVLALQGRFHIYEGYNAWQIGFPIRVLASLGVDTLLVSNAAGGMNPLFNRGDLMVLTDHINLLGTNSLIGPNVDAWGPRFPDMSEPYAADLREKAHAVALEEEIRLQEGVYVAVSGPALETRAEYRFLRTIGGDAVGMSTVPEAIVANHMGVRVMAISVITDMGLPDALEPLSLEDVLAAAAAAEPKLTALVKGVVGRL